MINKKLIRNIILAVVILGLLAAALIFAQKMPAKKEDTKPETTQSNDVEENITVVDLKTENVDSITVENENQTYTIVNKGKDKFELSDNGGIPYSDSLLSGNFSAFLTIYAQKDVTNENVAFTPSAKATVRFKDGSEKVITLGNPVIGENQYFLQYENKTYAVLNYIASYFNANTDQFRQTELGKISSSIKSVEIKKDGQDYVSFKAAENEKEANILDVSTNYLITYPKRMAASEDRLTPLFEKIGNEGYSISVVSFVDNDINNKGKYHIGKKTVSIDDGQNKYTIDFGDKDENGNVYAVFDGGNYIFTMDSSLFDILDTYTPDVLMEKSAHLVLITKINQVVIEGNNEKYTFDVSGKEDNYTYKINSKSIDEDKFKEAYREIIGISVDSMLNEPIKGGKSDYIVTFRYTNGKKAVYNYVSYDERNYVLQKDGQGEKILLKKRLPEVMANIKKIINKKD